MEVSLARGIQQEGPGMKDLVEDEDGNVCKTSVAVTDL